MAQCIVIGPVCGCVCGWVAAWVCYHDNSKLHASILTKLGLQVKAVTISSWLNFGRPAPPWRGLRPAAGRKFLAPPYCRQRAVFASPLSAFIYFFFVLFTGCRAENKLCQHAEPPRRRMSLRGGTWDVVVHFPASSGTLPTAAVAVRPNQSGPVQRLRPSMFAILRSEQISCRREVKKNNNLLWCWTSSAGFTENFTGSGILRLLTARHKICTIVVGGSGMP